MWELLAGNSEARLSPALLTNLSCSMVVSQGMVFLGVVASLGVWQADGLMFSGQQPCQLSRRF